MASLSVTEFVRQVRATVSDSEGSIWGDLHAVTADMFCALLEGMAESEVEARTVVKRIRGRELPALLDRSLTDQKQA